MLILTPADFSLAAAATPGAALNWVRSADGRQPAAQGQCAASLAPADDDCVFVLPPQAVSWHRLTLPKVAPARLRAVLDGLLEEQLLSDCGELHFALEPGGRPGQTVWVAATHKGRLQQWLQALEAAGRPVSRLAPMVWPLPGAAAGEPQALHWVHQQMAQPWLASASAQGVQCLPLQAAAGLPAARPPGPGAGHGGADGASSARWLSEPALAAQAEQWLDRRFELMSVADALLRSAQSDWNLAQFDLSLSGAARRGQRLRKVWRDVRNAPAWKPARWGLVALLLASVLGLNAAAWQESRLLRTKQLALGETLRRSFPDMGMVLDAPLQMRRGLERLQQASGTLSAGDLESMLGGLDLVSPDAPLSLASIDYNAPEARFGLADDFSSSWPDLQAALSRAGWQATLEDSTVVLRPKVP